MGMLQIRKEIKDFENDFGENEKPTPHQFFEFYQRVRSFAYYHEDIQKLHWKQKQKEIRITSKMYPEDTDTATVSESEIDDK